MTGFLPEGTNCELYAKVLNAADGREFTSQYWSKLERIGPVIHSASENRDDYIEIEYQIQGLRKDTHTNGVAAWADSGFDVNGAISGGTGKTIAVDGSGTSLAVGSRIRVGTALYTVASEVAADASSIVVKEVVVSAADNAQIDYVAEGNVPYSTATWTRQIDSNYDVSGDKSAGNSIDVVVDGGSGLAISDGARIRVGNDIYTVNGDVSAGASRINVHESVSVADNEDVYVMKERELTLNAPDTLKENDLLLVADQSVPTKYRVGVVSSDTTSTTVVLKDGLDIDTTGTPTYNVGKVKPEYLHQAFRDPGSAIEGAAAYFVPETFSRLEGFRTFAIKAVLTSDDHRKIPSLRDLRAIALDI